MEWQVRCSQGTTLAIKNNAYFNKGPNHTHIARIAIDNDPIVEKLFTSRDRQWEIRNSGGIKTGGKNREISGSSLFNYFVIGADHIISGLDHIAFLLGLLLLCRRVRDVIILVTGFTLGHSVTLGLGVLDLINPDPKTVQALIGFTIALVAVENIGEATRTNRSLGMIIGIAGMVMAILGAFFLKSGPPYLTMAGLALFSFCYLCMISQMGDRGFKLRPVVTFLFGLVHGFGFAGSLKEIGLPADRFLSALFGFNIGVEAGQLVIVILLWQAVKMIVRIFPVFQKQFQQRLLTDVIAASLCGLGLFWFISRAYS
ncbi:MAG: HupE/UreJ family protein [Desulfobacterales bacterium]|nr:HupE/UreJ family protein [Desulfobacterales bacterium]